MSPREAVYVIVPAAGSGSRMKLGHNKQFLELGRLPVIIRTLRAFERHPRVDGFIVLASEGDLGTMCDLIATHNLAKCLGVTPGGATRQASVTSGLDFLAKSKTIDPDQLDSSLILVHDGARCFVPGGVIDRVLEGIRAHQACGAALAVRDTIKLADSSGHVLKTLPRDQLWAMQTPQGAFYPLLKQAYEKAERDGVQATDDCALLEQAGYSVFLVAGDPRNIKLTTPEDRLLGEQLALMADKAGGL